MFRAKNDRRILELINSGRIVVQRIPADSLFDESGNSQQPGTEILTLNLKTGRLRPVAISFNGFGGAPRFVARFRRPNQRGRSKAVWLSVRRTVWLAEKGKPSMFNIVPIDGDQANWNIENLCERDQHDQNVCWKHQRYLEDSEMYSSESRTDEALPQRTRLEDDIPF